MLRLRSARMPTVGVGLDEVARETDGLSSADLKAFVRKGPCLTGSGLSFGSLDRYAKPLLQFVGVDALVVAPFRHGATERHDALRWEGDENVLNRRERIALTGDTVSVDPGVVESLDCLSLDQLCPSDRLVGVGEPKAKSRAVKRRRHDQDLRVIGSPSKRSAQTIGENRLAASPLCCGVAPKSAQAKRPRSRCSEVCAGSPEAEAHPDSPTARPATPLRKSSDAPLDALLRAPSRSGVAGWVWPGGHCNDPHK